MINVLYPVLDLVKAYVQLIKDLKTIDWDKTTYYKNESVSIIALDLFKDMIHILAENSQLNSAIDMPKEKLSNLESFKLLLPELDLMLQNIENFKQSNIPQLYNELWLKQQHIRYAVFNQDLMQKQFYFPFLNYNMLALAKHYEFVEAELNTVIKVEVVGNAGGVWTIKKTVTGWDFTDMEEKTPNALIYIDQQIAWLLLTRGVNLIEANQYYQILGDRDLGSHVLKMNFGG
ncbi:hypothetical protein [Pedobacter alpinus]|uniref:Uncharacterized protein n=1 Tax=Pedobacter alpinus TaxID=1590643 RepID=A0ABW5TUK2_9SPHI